MLIGEFLRELREKHRRSREEWGIEFAESVAYIGRAERNQIDHDDKFRAYLQRIQLKYDSEVLGSYICGVNNYLYQRQLIFTLCKQHGINMASLAFQRG